MTREELENFKRFLRKIVDRSINIDDQDSPRYLFSVLFAAVLIMIVVLAAMSVVSGYRMTVWLIVIGSMLAFYPAAWALYGIAYWTNYMIVRARRKHFES